MNPEAKFEKVHMGLFDDKSRLHYYDPQAFLNDYLEHLGGLVNGLQKHSFWDRHGYPYGFWRPSYQRTFDELWKHKTTIFLDENSKKICYQKQDLAMNSIVFERFVKFLLMDVGQKLEKISSLDLERWSFQRKKSKISCDGVSANQSRDVTNVLKENRNPLDSLAQTESNEIFLKTGLKEKRDLERLQGEKEILEILYGKKKSPINHRKPNQWKRNSFKFISGSFKLGITQGRRLLGGMDEKDQDKNKKKNKNRNHLNQKFQRKKFQTFQKKSMNRRMIVVREGVDGLLQKGEGVKEIN